MIIRTAGGYNTVSLSLLLALLSMIQFNSNLARACHHLESLFMHEAEILHGNTQPALRRQYTRIQPSHSVDSVQA